MKSKILFLLIFSILYSNVYAHKEWVHQHIVYQAYLLLKNYYSIEIPEIETNLGSFGSGDGPWIHGEILKGAFREDLEDVVTGNGGWLVGWVPSSTHFWDVDASDLGDIGIGALENTVPLINAYRKTSVFMNGGWRLSYNGGVYIYNSLSDLYINGNLHKVGYYDEIGELHNTDSWIIASAETRRILVWEILGRICHLLEDMTIPAHVHLDPHVCGLDTDNYENEVAGAGNGYLNCDEQVTFPGMYTNYTAGTTFNCSSFIDPYARDLINPLRYLFWYSAQIADHFADQDNAGDNLVWNNPYPGMSEYLSSLGPGIPAGQVNTQEFANVLMNLSINVTASLLYVFAMECDLIKSITITSSKLNDFVQVRNPARSVPPYNSQYYWKATPYTLNFDNNIKIDLLADAYNGNYAFLNWKKYDRHGVWINGTNELEWLDANATTTSTFVANYAPLISISFNPIQIEANVGAHYKNIGTEEIASSFTFPKGFPQIIEAVAPAEYSFIGWSDDDWGWSPNPRSFNPESDLSGIYARFKKINASNEPTAYSSNGQRKFVRSYDGTLFSVYSSMGKVWIEYSTNNGSSWELGNERRPLFEGLPAKNPCIEFWNLIDANLNQKTYLMIAAQVNINGGSDIQISRMTWVNPYNFDELNHIPITNEVFMPTMPYSQTSLNPVIAMVDPAECLLAVSLNEYNTIWWQTGIFDGTWHINWDAGHWNFISSENRSFSNLSLCSTKYDLDISQHDGYHCWLAYQENSSTGSNIVVRKFSYGFYGDLEVSDAYLISDNGWPKNYNPSITASWDQEPTSSDKVEVVWIGYKKNALPDNPGDPISLGETKVFYKSYDNWNWSGEFKSYGNDIKSVNINKNSNNSFVFAWSANQNNTNYYVKSSNLNSINTTNTTGQYIQVGNFNNFNYMKSNAFSTSTVPYSFSVSNTFGAVIPEDDDIYTDRTSTIIKDTTAFYFAIGEIIVNGENIDFVEVPDTVIFNDFESLNSYTLSQPFVLNNNSIFTYGIEFGVSDSLSAIEALRNGKSINFKVQLLDYYTKEIISTFDDILFDSTSIIPFQIAAYQVDVQGIGNKTCQLKLYTEDNLDNNYSLVNTFNTEANLSKNSFIKRSLSDEQTINSYNLYQNFPNPFNPATTINYQIPQTGFVTLKIYDILGKEVAALVNEQKTQGRYSVNFDASRLASGVYIYQFRVNDYVSSKKMLLIK